MNITLENIGKRFNREWIFRQLDYEFNSGSKTAILGTNGSGKSTLLQIISGSMTQSEGKIKYDRQELPDTLFKLVSYAAPYLELPEEMTWGECVSFHGKFKKYVDGFNTEKILSLSGLESSCEKQIINFSSGMKQRAKLSLAILSDTPLLLIDEPLSNLDESGTKWYLNLISNFTRKRTVIVCSNHNKEEYLFCENQFQISKY